MPTNKLLFVVGSAYTGSSILSVLMDRVKGVVSMGEGARVYRPGSMFGPCATCGAADAGDDCSLFKEWVPAGEEDLGNGHEATIAHAVDVLGRKQHEDRATIDVGESIYQFVGRKYPDAHTIVDSSKDPTMMVEQRQTGPNYETNVVFLSKTPQEAFASYHRHPAPMTPHDCVVEWLRVNMYYYGFLEINGASVLHVSYRDLARRSEETIADICKFCGIKSEYRPECHKPYGHILGGNPAVSSVVSHNDDLCFRNGTRATHMGGKYAEVDPLEPLHITYDDSHKNLPFDFRSECQHEMDKRAHKIGPMLQLLGYGANEMRLY